MSDRGDVIDRANDLALAQTDAAIAAARHSDVTPPDFCCECDGCDGGMTGKGCIWYPSCLQDWERRDSARRRNGA